jgi:hypothetical protein
MATKAQIFFPALSGLRYDGAALALGRLYFYEPGTTTLRTVWANRNKTVVATMVSDGAGGFYVELDANAQTKVFLDGIYDVLVKSAAGVTKDTWPGYEGSSTDSALNVLEEVSTADGDVVKTLPTNTSIAQYVKSTADANVVTFTTSDGSTFAESGLQLDVEASSITFVKVGTVWYRV